MNFPRMFYYPEGTKSYKLRVEYRSVIEPETLAQWANDQYIIGTVKKVIEL